MQDPSDKSGKAIQESQGVDWSTKICNSRLRLSTLLCLMIATVVHCYYINKFEHDGYLY